MIEYDDFIKLFVIINSFKGETLDYVYDSACKAAHLLHENDHFDSKRQVTPNDFLANIKDIESAIDRLPL